jgi:hypothetical protein
MGHNTYRPLVHNNDWRAPDGRAAGLDSWVGLHYTWVRLDQQPDEVVVGGAVSGEFQMLFDGAESQSRLLVRGEFTIDKVKADKWTTQVVAEEKFKENETYLCGEPAWEE